MLRRTALLTVATALCTLSVLAACGSDNDNTSPNNTSMVRIVNASSTTTGLNATSGSTTLSSGLNFQNTNMAASCTTIPSGNQTINFTSSSSTTGIGSVTYNFLPGQAYTVVFFGNNNAVVFPETFTAPTSGNYAVRFINATANSSDVYVTAPGATLTSTSTASSAGILSNSVSGFNATTATGGTFTSFPTGSNFVRTFKAGANPSTATSTGSFTILSMSTTGAQTVIFTAANASNSNATAFQVNSCK